MRRSRGLRALLQEFLWADPLALLAVATLVLLGELNLIAIGEPGLALHQLLAIGLGLGFLVAVQRLRAESLPWLGRIIYVLAVVMLVAVDAGGSRAYGAQRWLAIGSLVLQPSEPPSWACCWPWPMPSACAGSAGPALARPRCWRWRRSA